MAREKQILSAYQKLKEKLGSQEHTFMCAAIWADSHPHWISVEDELPPKKSKYDGLSNNVLATDGKEIYESVYNHDFGEWFTHDLWAINNITHWMPLPAPPKSSCSEIPTNCQSVTLRNQSKGGEK